MCDDRERLIGYVYDECDPQERGAVEAHLASCATCRTEIAGLRSVRQDLLAWDVPEHGSVWRPFVPVRVAPSWRDLPAWGLAAAACVLLAAGAVGGIATHALLPHESAPMVAATPPQALPAAVSAGLSDAEVTALERRLFERLRAEVNATVRSVSMSAPAAPRQAARQDDVTDDQFEWYRAINADLQRLNNRTVSLEQKNNLILTSIEMASQDGLRPVIGR